MDLVSIEFVGGPLDGDHLDIPPYLEEIEVFNKDFPKSPADPHYGTTPENSIPLAIGTYRRKPTSTLMHWEGWK